jgi:hypothetical protein
MIPATRLKTFGLDSLCPTACDKLSANEIVWKNLRAGDAV